MAHVELTSTGPLKRIMAAYFQNLGEVARTRSKKLAWCTSVGPAELLRALGFEVFFPENHGAMLGASRLSTPCMGRAHALGYSPDACSYMSSDIGSYLTKKTPLAAFGMETQPRPDVLVFNTNQCRDVRDWFEYFGRTYDVPVIGVTSLRGVDDVSEQLVDAMAPQFEALVPPLEAIAGTRLDPERLKETMRLSRRGTELWKRCLETATARPSPWSFFDGTIHMGPAVVLRGTEVACDYYEELARELEERVAAAAGLEKGARTAASGGPKERYRLFWDGMPIWGKLRSLSDLFSELGACVVASTYCNSWIFEALDPEDPFRSMARASLELFIARSEGPKERYLTDMASQYGVDGFVFHDARTCPNNSNTRYGMPRRLQQRLGIPTLVIDGDLNDLRCFSEEQTHTNVEGFIEQLEAR